MNEQLKAAAERLRRASLNDAGLYTKDIHTLADAWLAENLADDQEAIADDWLLALREKIPALGFSALGSYRWVAVDTRTGYGPDSGVVHGYVWARADTRGDVRRLLAALKIEAAQ